MYIDEILSRQLFPEPLPADEFLAAWEEDIGDPDSELCVRQFSAKLPKLGKISVYQFIGGLCATEDRKGRWMAWESQARVDERKYYSDWAAFARGHWVEKVPSVEGTYPTRDQLGWRGKDRKIMRVNGRLLDVSGGEMVPLGQVSTWRGSWWSLPFPKLRGCI